VKPTPPGWPRISSSIHYRDPATRFQTEMRSPLSAGCSYGALDPEGQLWWFSERVRDPPA
jgi:hypothetical protein